MINPSEGSGIDQGNSLSGPETSLTYGPNQPSPDTSLTLQRDELVFEQKKSVGTATKVSFLGLAILILLIGGAFFFFQRQASTPLQAGDFNEIRLPLKEISSSSTLGAQILKVRGQVAISSGLTLSPSEQPKAPIAGQLYFDKDRKQMRYFDGAQFILLQGGSGPTINTISNVSTGGSTITNIFNSTSGSLALSGTAGNLALFTSNNSLGNSLIQQNGTTLQVATSGTNAVSLGSGSGSSATTIQGGTGNILIATGSSAGITGSISISSGNSSTTASGNISIDSGSGVIDGEVVEDKTFESGLDAMQDWFNTSLASTTAQAHSGSQSLQVTPSSAFWGIIEVLPGTTVTPGHQYHFSIWIRAASTPRTINASIVWQGANTTTSFTPAVDSTTGWTEMTLTAPAPAGATSVSFRMQSSTGAAGEVHYFDDVSITDLSSGTAISAIDLGSTNAKVITIGNLNQIGATTIRGGSGVSIQSGAAATVINGGTLNMTGNAASSLSTTSGALTITSAATAIWGVGTASSGVGGDLAIHAGQGGSDTNNDGGDLLLQGGARNGTGTAGSVIVKPPTDVVDAFQLQNSSGVAFFVADSATKKISITGSGSAFASLALNNAHFSTSQTTAPTIGALTNCGTSPLSAVTAGSTDMAGSFSITTGSGGTASSCGATITFSQAYSATPKSIIIIGKTDAASAARQIYVSSSAAATFTTAFGVSAGGANGATYNFSYWVIE